MGKRLDILPQSLPPRGLNRIQAAAYIGISPSLFDRLILEKRMPKPKLIFARRVWDRQKIDIAFDQINGDNDTEIGDIWNKLE